MRLPFLDTNVLLRHLLEDHADFSPRATAFLARIELGEIQVRTADPVILETVFTLQRGYKFPKAEIRATLMPLIELPGIVLPGKHHFSRVFDVYVNYNISFVDAYHVVLMERLGLDEIVTFDREFDRVPGLARLEP
jgi:predicted nucleic acid-binding protein